MKQIRARNVGEVSKSLQSLDKDLCRLSPETALIFRERIQSILRHAALVGLSNSRSGIVTAETVALILENAKEIFRLRGVSIDPEEYLK